MSPLHALFPLVLVLVLVLTGGAPGQAQESDVGALVERMERHYADVADFEARFTQRYERRLLARTVEESGRIMVKKPGRMRWEYESPEEKLFVTDGTSSYFYLPAEQQVMVSHNPQGAMGLQEGSPFEILAGKSRMSDSFTFFSSDSQPTRGGVVLQAIPMVRHTEFDDVEIEVRPDDGLILRVVLIDAQRNRTEFIFDDVRENLDLADANFRFTVPSGVEVVVQSEQQAQQP